MKKKLEIENKRILDLEAQMLKNKSKNRHQGKNTSSFMTMDRSKVFDLNNPLPPGNSNFGIYRPKFDRVEKRVTYKNLHFANDKLLDPQPPQFSTLEPTQVDQKRLIASSEGSDSEVVVIDNYSLENGEQ